MIWVSIPPFPLLSSLLHIQGVLAVFMEKYLSAMEGRRDDKHRLPCVTEVRSDGHS